MHSRCTSKVQMVTLKMSGTTEGGWEGGEGGEAREKALFHLLMELEKVQVVLSRCSKVCTR